jgi:hypothetical protein
MGELLPKKRNKEEPRRPGIEESSRINRDCGHQA